MSMCKRDDRLPHQKINFFIASKRVSLYKIDPQRKPWNVYYRICKLIDLPHIKRKPLTTTGVDGSMFWKNIEQQYASKS